MYTTTVVGLSLVNTHIYPSKINTPCNAVCYQSVSWSKGCRNTNRSIIAYAEFGGLSDKIVLSNGTIDYYEVLGVDDDANFDQIKTAYRSLAKECHPDYLGEEGHQICLMLNEAYEVLSDPDSRQLYNQELQLALEDEGDGFNGETLSYWVPTRNPKMAKNEDPDERRGVFVDELTCIGCKNCMWCAPATFRMEREYGRSRVFGQWLNTEAEIQEAIDSCPVDCIHWVDKEELPYLEWVTQKKTSRMNIAVMMTGGVVDDVFMIAEKFKKQREELRRKREKNQKMSASQQAARRKAAEDMIKQMGWLGSIATSFFSMDSMLNNNISNGYSSDGEQDMSKVGNRKRSKRYSEHMQAALTNGSGSDDNIPAERALVPVGVEIHDG